eukprot:1719452-Pyramimonas_sp.AAC.1
MCSALASAAGRVQHLRQYHLDQRSDLQEGARTALDHIILLHEGFHSLTSDELVQGMSQVVVAVEAVAACEVARGTGKARKAYADWVRRMWRTSPGALHRHVRDPVAPRPEDATVETTASPIAANAVAGPITTMANKSAKWGRIWSDAVDTPASITQALAAIRQKAVEEDIPPLQSE